MDKTITLTCTLNEAAPGYALPAMERFDGVLLQVVEPVVDVENSRLFIKYSNGPIDLTPYTLHIPLQVALDLLDCLEKISIYHGFERFRRSRQVAPPDVAKH